VLFSQGQGPALLQWKTTDKVAVSCILIFPFLYWVWGSQQQQMWRVQCCGMLHGSTGPHNLISQKIELFTFLDCRKILNKMVVSILWIWSAVSVNLLWISILISKYFHIDMCCKDILLS
jgi:hypothetical protein